MMYTERLIRTLAGLIIAVSLGGCLSTPTGLDCAEAPPGTAGCDDPTTDGATDRAPPGPEAGPPDAAPDSARPDGALPDAALPDGALPDGALPDGAPPDGWTADARPADAAPDGGPGSACAAAPCPAPPVELACLDDLTVTIADPICTPTACGDDPDCDPATLECRAFVGCLLWCLLVDGRADCEETCAGGEPDPEAINRFEVLGACLEAADCEDGPQGAECQFAACSAEIEGCVGDIGRLWFVRPPNPGAAIGCDYPFESGDDCRDRDLRCRQGECVDADGPCTPDPCAVRPELRCEGGAVVRGSPPVCAVEGDEAVCSYAEERTPCDAPPPRCDRDTLIESRNPRCVADVQGVYCTQDDAVTDCTAAPAASCDGNTAVVPDPGRCAAAAGEAACVSGEVRRTDCSANSNVCQRGACVRSTCGLSCEARNIRGCDIGGEAIYAACDREQYCERGACQQIPVAYGSACRTAEDTATCERAGLTCRGLAVVPQCLFGDSPRAIRETCWTTADCDRALICTRAGICTVGARGSACEDAADCQAGSRCQRGSCL